MTDVEAVPRVAVVGRPNVGKSTLVNRLLGRRVAIAHESRGVTRDRKEATAQWQGRSVVLVDTGGMVDRARGLEASVAKQATYALDRAQLALLVVDVTAGITADDEALAARLRGSTKPVLVVANKVDSAVQEPMAAEFHGLGLGEPVAVSALHGRGSGELLDLIVQLTPDEPAPEVEEEARFSIVGRANVGKSLMFNRLVGEDRAIVHDVPGTTRDAIDSVVEVEGRRVRFVDTAGFRRPGKAGAVEYYGVVRSLEAVDSSDVALLVVDASEGLTWQDKRVASRVAKAGRGLVVALNKWDLVPSEHRAALFADLKRQLELFPGAPVLRTSALTGSGVGKVLPALTFVDQAWSRRVPTAEVNRVLERAVAAFPPPVRLGHLRYATQVAARPPLFVLFGTDDPGHSYRRYLENVLRREFGFAGVPIRLSFRPRPPRGRGSASAGRAKASGARATARRSRPRRGAGR